MFILRIRRPFLQLHVIGAPTAQLISEGDKNTAAANRLTRLRWCFSIIFASFLIDTLKKKTFKDPHQRRRQNDALFITYIYIYIYITYICDRAWIKSFRFSSSLSMSAVFIEAGSQVCYTCGAQLLPLLITQHFNEVTSLPVTGCHHRWGKGWRVTLW